MLNARKDDLASFVARGGGIVAFDERGQWGGVWWNSDLLENPFGYLPLPGPPVNRFTEGMTVELRVTPAGKDIGLTDADVNGHWFYQWFRDTTGWDVIDRDTRFKPDPATWEPVSLATRNPISCRLFADHVSLPEGDSGTSSFDFKVNLVGTEPQPVAVRYSTEDGTAKAGEDYVATSGNFTLQPGETLKTVSVPVNGDGTPEPDETFSLRLAFTIGTETAEVYGNGTILNDDGPPGSSSGGPSEDALRAETAGLLARQEQLPGHDPGAAAGRQQNANSQLPPSQTITQVQANPQIQIQSQAQPQPQPQIQTQIQQQMQTQAQSQIQGAAAPMIEAASQAEVRVEQVRDSDRRDDRERRPRNDGYRAAARSPYPQAILSFGGWFVGLMGLVLGLSRTGRTSRPSAVRVQSGGGSSRGSPRPPNHRRRLRN